MSEDQQRKEDTERVAAALATLIEHFDAVQIFASRHEEGEFGGTAHVAKGSGNWFTRYGQVSEWLLREDEIARDGMRTKPD